MKIEKENRILVTMCSIYAVGIAFSIKSFIDLRKENKKLGI